MTVWRAWSIALVIAGYLIRGLHGPSVPPADSKQESEDSLREALDSLLDKAPPDQKESLRNDLDSFKLLLHRYLTETDAAINWKMINKLPQESMIDYTSLPTPIEGSVSQMLRKLVVVKLNGGLGTSMGCQGPKSVIPVHGDQTFLDLTVRQIENLIKTYKESVPLVLMNSFNTDEETQKIISKYKNVQIHTFQQRRYPRLFSGNLMPVAKTTEVKDNLDAWYPPGHGDFYESFKKSGLLEKFISEGREWVFISNIDNLGATVDINILNSLLGQKASGRTSSEFLMEITEKTRADVKGGTLVQYQGKVRLLELAQVPKYREEEFKSVKKFKYFNTNNLWINLGAIDRVVKDGSLNMELIVNPKVVNDVPVIQLETAVGAAIKSFDGSTGIIVPRSRFLPVKKTSDLLLASSNLYTLKGGALVMSPLRMFPTVPMVQLSEAQFSKVKDFQARFPSIPNMVELDHLTVSGDVTFGKQVTLKGTVIIVAKDGERIDIPDGAILENKIISGNIRIHGY